MRSGVGRRMGQSIILINREWNRITNYFVNNCRLNYSEWSLSWNYRAWDRSNRYHDVITLTGYRQLLFVIIYRKSLFCNDIIWYGRINFLPTGWGQGWGSILDSTGFDGSKRRSRRLRTDKGRGRRGQRGRIWLQWQWRKIQSNSSLIIYEDGGAIIARRQVIRCSTYTMRFQQTLVTHPAIKHLEFILFALLECSWWSRELLSLTAVVEQPAFKCLKSGILCGWRVWQFFK